MGLTASTLVGWGKPVCSNPMPKEGHLTMGADLALRQVESKIAANLGLWQPMTRLAIRVDGTVQS